MSDIPSQPNPSVPPRPIPDDVGSPVVDSWFRRMPNGGTVFVSDPPRPSSVNHVTSRFRETPTGGGTSTWPTGGGTTYAQSRDSTNAE